MPFPTVMKSLYGEKATGMPSTVLVIEDDPDTVRLVSLYLKRDGHEILSAGDGIRGIRLAKQAQPDLVVLDMAVLDIFKCILFPINLMALQYWQDIA